MSTGAVKNNQSADHAQNGGGLNPGQDYMDLYTVKPDSIGSGQISPNSHDRGREHTKGSN